jgi:Cytochrome c554 and c-prime
MMRRKLIAGLVCAGVAAAGVVTARPQKYAGAGLEARTQESQQKIETSMATDERLEGAGWWPRKRSASLHEFAGTAECARCHAEKTASQLKTPMARAAATGADSQVLREHEKISRQLGAYRYAITREGPGSVYSVSDGSASISEPLAWAFGLGNKGQTYVYERGGQFYESRMSFYTSLQGLDLTTGHASDTPKNLADALGRVLDRETVQRCFGCHTTAATTTAGFDTARLTPGVDCEACHGPGAKHAELMDEEKNAEGRLAIFNPGQLGAVVQVDFCGACHRTLNDVYEMGVRGVANVRFQPYRLENSKCWGDGDARLACIACHDPHKELSHDDGGYDAKCLACHVTTAAVKTSREHPGKACPVAKKDCVTCHMPRVQLPSMHAPFVDHRIRIVRAKASYPD